MVDEVGEDLVGVEVLGHGSFGDMDDLVGAGPAVHVLALAVDPVGGAAVRMVAEREE